MGRVVKFLSVSVLLGAAVVFYLVRFQGLRIERDGSGWKPMFSFYHPEEHLAAIERNRAPVPAPPVEPAAAQPSAPAAEPSKPTAPPAVPAPKAAVIQAYWTDFRGPRRDGLYDQMPILTKWPPQGPERLWRKPIGGGYASFVVAGGKAFTIEQRRDQEVVAAYDVASGSEVWSHGWSAFFQESMGGDGPRATPTWHDGRIYALGAEGELRCLDAQTGRRIWSKNILSDNGAENLHWGMSAAPLVVDDKVIVLPGGSGGKSVVAYNRLTGEPIWKALDDKAAYVSPIVATLAGARQIVVVTGSRVAGLTIDKGTLLWEFPWITSNDINSAQPVIIDADRFIISAGYGHGAALVRVVKSGDSFTAREIWQNTRMKNKFSSSVLHEGHIYGLDEAILTCLNVETGEQKWKGGRYGFGQIILASGHIIVAAENGDVALVRATPDRHEELVRFSAIEGKTWNHPVIADGILLVRNTVEMAAFRVN